MKSDIDNNRSITGSISYSEMSENPPFRYNKGASIRRATSSTPARVTVGN